MPNTSEIETSTGNSQSPGILTILIRLVAIFLFINFLSSFFNSKSSHPSSSASPSFQNTNYLCNHYNSSFKAVFYLTTSPTLSSADQKSLHPFHIIPSLTFNSSIPTTDLFYKPYDFSTTYYIHILIITSSPPLTTTLTHPLTITKPIKHKAHRLLLNKPTSNPNSNTTGSYWLTKLNLRLINSPSLDSNYLMHIHSLGITPTLYSSKNKSSYDPYFYVDKFWVLEEDYILIHPSRKTLPLKISFNPISPYWFQLQTSLNRQWGSSSDLIGKDDLESFKRMIGDNHISILVITFIVTVLHSVFEFMAFKHDINFWKDKEAVKGISIRTIYFNIISQLIISLYLLRNETSPVIKVTSFIGLFIEIWKVTKAVNIKVTFWKFIPKFKFEYKDSYVKSDTDKYDKIAINYLSVILLPLVLFYSVYSLFFENYDHWIDWVLNSLAGSVYTFGFILMCPQVYINYKMKSVAHLPRKMFIYKFLNTIIDDLFSWVIKMPLLSRIACLRDDLIFIIYLYQKWIYRVDYERDNEFGYSERKEEKEKLD